jgi:hypothetical protein
VAQEAFVRAMSTLARFDTARPFAPWLTRIAVNAALDELRRERRLGPEEPTAAEAAPEPAVAVVRAVARLAPERRLIVALHYWLDYLTPEIAELLDLPLGTVARFFGGGKATPAAREAAQEELDRLVVPEGAPGPLESLPAGPPARTACKPAALRAAVQLQGATGSLLGSIRLRNTGGAASRAPFAGARPCSCGTQTGSCSTRNRSRAGPCGGTSERRSHAAGRP